MSISFQDAISSIEFNSQFKQQDDLITVNSQLKSSQSSQSAQEIKEIIEKKENKEIKRMKGIKEIKGIKVKLKLQLYFLYKLDF